MGPHRLPVPPLRPGGGPDNRGSAVVTPNRSPRSALGNPPLNHIQEDLLHLFAGLLDLLEPDFASSRGARREPRAQRSRAREGEPAQVSGSEPSHPPKHTPSPTHRAWPIPHVGRRPRGRERAAAASQSGVHRLLAAVAARDGRGGLGSRCGGRGRACGGRAIPTAQEAGPGGWDGVGGPAGARDTAALAWACACSCPCTNRYI